jgi:multiple sugar transport system substrate-binding protein
MTNTNGRDATAFRLRRRGLAAYSVAALLGTTIMFSATVASYAQSIDVSKWSPDYVRSIAGTAKVDTAAECSKVTPLDYKGKLTYWYTGPNNASPDIDKKIDADFWAAWKKTYPNIETNYQNIDYNVLLDKLRTSLLGNAAPMVVRLQIVGGVEFTSKGYFQELKAEDVGYTTSDFWPGAVKSDMWNGKQYGIPTNNETMAFIYNADIFKRAGLDPDHAPKTWDDVVKYSKQIHDKLGIPGNTPVTRHSGSCPSFGPLAGARSTRRPRRRTTSRSGSTTLARKPRCRPWSTCMSATNRCRSLR